MIWSPSLVALRLVLAGAQLRPFDDPVWSGFRGYLRDLSVVGARLAAVAALLTNLVGWLGDATLLGDPVIVHHFMLWRGGTSVCLVAILIGLTWWPWARLHPAYFASPIFFACTFWIAWVLGEIGGPATSWPYWLNLIPAVVAGVPATLPQRLALVFGAAACVLIGYHGLHPEFAAGRPFVDALQFLGTTCVLALVTGEGLYGLLALLYLNQQENKARAARLEEFNRGLEATVDARTAEVRALGEHLRLVRDRERTRIAQELHDELGQQLAGARYALAAASRHAPELLAEPARMLASASDTTRRIVHGLRPLVLEQLGLAAACEWLVRTTAEHAGLAHSLRFEGDPGWLDKERAMAIYRVLQEALTNVVRHAQAARVAVTIEVGPHALVLHVDDDGRGPGEIPRPGLGGMGLLGMSERARAYGGEIEFGPGPDGGARVRLRIPRP